MNVRHAVDRMWHDLKHALRLFAKSPGFTAIAVLSIAGGTGANVAMFSAADALLLRPVPVRDANSLITISATPPTRVRGPISRTSYADFNDIRVRSRSFDPLVAYSVQRVGVSASPADPKQVKVVTCVTGNFFDALAIPLHLGRGFAAEEDRVPNRDAVAVISYGMWQHFFTADPAVVGRSMTIAGTVFTVVGVTSQSFTGIDTDTARDAVYVPFAMWARLMNAPDIEPLTQRDLRAVTIKTRFKRGVSRSQAQAELTSIADDLAAAYPDSHTGYGLVAQTELQFRAARTPLRTALMLLLSVLSSAVLLVACANVAGLLTSRAPLRARELAVRHAVGGSRRRLISQLLSESAVLAVVGGVAGLAVGYAGIVIINQLQYPTDIVAVAESRLDLRVLAFNLALAMGSAILFGLGPALTSTRIDLSSSFRTSDSSALRRWRLGGRSQLVAVQIALSLVVITVAAITFQVFTSTFREGPGFRTTGIAKISINAREGGYRGARAIAFFERTLEAARALPDVVAAGATSAMPLWGMETTQILPEHASLSSSGAALSTFAAVIDDGYFATMEIPIIEGRAFRATDSQSAPLVAIVNDTMAKRYWPRSSAVGQRFRLNGSDGPSVEVIGVARASMYHYPGEPPTEMVYYPYRQHPRSDMTILAQSRGPSADLLPALSRVVHGIDPNVAVYDAHTMERFYAALSTNLANVIISLIAGIGVVGTTISVIGLYGLVSYSVNRRTREIGIRIAVGATYANVLRLILRQGLAPAWTGIACGCVLSVVAARFLPAVLPTNEAYDARGLFGFVPLLLALTLLAAFLPARRATTVNPAITLRHE